MKILDNTYDWSDIVGYGGCASPMLNQEIGKKLDELRTEGYARVIGQTNSYGFPRYLFAFTGDEPRMGAALCKPRTFEIEL